MDWLARDPHRRVDPRALWSEVRAIVMLGLNYAPGGDPLAILARRAHGAVSVYAQGDDYHDIIKPRLKSIARWLVQNGGGDVKVFVDTAAVMEKPLAAAAGLGWQGKHTNLVSRDLGSWLFLGAIFTTLALPPDAPEADHCGTCRACLDVCPTAAFPAPYRLDARRCISYLTIEHKGPIPRELRPLMGNRIYGCDDCLAVCPWNKFAQAGREQKLAAREACARRGSPISPGSTTLRSARCSPSRRSSAPAATASCATSRSRSAIPVIPRSPPRPSASSMTPPRWCAAPPCGRLAGSTVRASQHLRGATRAMRQCVRNGPSRSPRRGDDVNVLVAGEDARGGSTPSS